MARKGQKLTGKALTAARRNIKKAQAAQRGGGRRKSKSNPRRSPAKRRAAPSRGPFGRGATKVLKITQKAADVGVKLSTASIVTTPFLGRSIVHPLGGLHEIRRTGDDPNVDINNPFSGAKIPSDRVILDPILVASDPIGQMGAPDDKIGSRARAFGAAVSYNLRAIPKRDNLRAYFGPVVVALAARGTVAVLTPAVVGLARLGDDIMKSVGQVTR